MHLGVRKGLVGLLKLNSEPFFFFGYLLSVLDTLRTYRQGLKNAYLINNKGALTQ